MITPSSFSGGDGGTGWWHGKTLIYDEGVRVPLIIRFPEKYQHLAPAKPRTVDDSIVTLMDLGPSLLSLSGLTIPEYMQGRVFLGPQARAARQYAIALRDRFGGCPISVVPSETNVTVIFAISIHNFLIVGGMDSFRPATEISLLLLLLIDRTFQYGKQPSHVKNSMMLLKIQKCKTILQEKLNITMYKRNSEKNFMTG